PNSSLQPGDPGSPRHPRPHALRACTDVDGAPLPLPSPGGGARRTALLGAVEPSRDNDPQGKTVPRRAPFEIMTPLLVSEPIFGRLRKASGELALRRPRSQRRRPGTLVDGRSRGACPGWSWLLLCMVSIRMLSVIAHLHD